MTAVMILRYFGKHIRLVTRMRILLGQRQFAGCYHAHLS
jgi:hypothetical protein